MNKHYVKLCFCCLSYLFSALSFSVSAQTNLMLTTFEKNVIAEQRALQVGITKSNLAPYFIISDRNLISGIYPQYLDHVAAKLNLPLHYQVYESIEQLNVAIANGALDIVMGVQLNQVQYQQSLALSLPILSTPHTFLVDKLQEDKVSHGDYSELKLAMYQSDATTQYSNQQWLNVDKFVVDKQKDIAPALSFGLANGHYSDSLINQYLLSQLDANRFINVELESSKSKQWRILLHKENPVLNSIINRVIEQTDPITITAIVAQETNRKSYNKNPKMIVSANQQKWLETHQVIRYTTLPDWHTITMHDKYSQPKGLSISVLNRIAKLLGVELEYVPSRDIADALSQVQSGGVDIVPAIIRTQARAQQVNFSIPYLSTPWSLIVNKDSHLTLKQLRQGNYQITSPNGDYARAIVSDYFTQGEQLVSRSMQESLQLLKAGKADAIFTTLTTAQAWLDDGSEQHYKLIQNFSVDNNINVQLGVTKQHPELRALIDQALEAVGYDELERMSRSWVELNPEQGVNVKKIIFYSVITASIFLAIVIGFVYWNRKLRHEVEFRKVAQKRALKAEKKLSSIADAIPGAVVQFTLNEKQLLLSYASQGIEDITPFKQRNLFNKKVGNEQLDDLLSIISASQKAQLLTAAEQALSNNHGIDIEFVLNKPHTRWLNLVAFATQGEHGCYWSGVLLEINQRKEQEFALAHEKVKAEQAAQAKSHFLAMMSHEIRTPLSGVITTSELLTQSSLDFQQREDVDTINTSAHNLLHILNDVLDHTKMEEQQFAVEIIECDLLEIVESAIKSHIATAQSKQLQLDFYFAPTTPRYVETDPVRLQQVLSNLLSNAVKFTDRGKITITVQPRQQGLKFNSSCPVEFIVKDSGLGIAGESQSKLFTPFMQAESSTNRQFGGTGLGLSICRMLVNRLGGEISLQSELGKGSQFSFSIPLKVYKTTQLPSTPCTKKLIILDDNSEAIKSVVRYLRLWQVDFINFNEATQTNLRMLQNAVIIHHKKIANLNGIKAVSTGNIWVKLCETNLLEGSVDHYISTNPLLVTPLINILAMACKDKFSEQCVSKAQVPAQLSSKKDAEAAGRLVLVAEDHPTNRKVIKRQLESLGYQADYVENGRQALDAIRAKNYGLLITDCHMPELDGYELTRQLRELGYILPIIAFTANALTGEAERCLEIGMNGYISKPVSQQVLDAKLKKYLPPIPHISNDTVSTVVEPKRMGIDMASLQQLFGDKQQVVELLNEFVVSAEEDLSALKKALLDADYEAQSDIAHRLKGASKMMLATELVKVIEQFEHAAKLKQGTDVYSLYEQLCKQLSSYNQFKGNVCK